MGFFDTLSGAFGQVGGALDTVTGFANQLGGALNAVESLSGGSAPIYLPPSQPLVFHSPSSPAPPPQGGLGHSGLSSALGSSGVGGGSLGSSAVEVPDSAGSDWLADNGNLIAVGVVTGVIVFLVTR